MPDTYFTIPDEKGSINISEDVIAAITGNALSELEGIAAFSNTAGSELSELIGKKSISKGIRSVRRRRRPSAWPWIPSPASSPWSTSAWPGSPSTSNHMRTLFAYEPLALIAHGFA